MGPGYPGHDDEAVFPAGFRLDASRNGVAESDTAMLSAMTAVR